ncbi:MAG: N-acetylmuramoyl-L-alanine amidase [Traorella sp.]
MAYVKKPKRKIKWRVALPLFCLIVVIIYLIINLLFPKEEKPNNTKICTYDSSRTYSLLSQEYENTYEINDYFFYGENLTLLKEPYQLGKTDDLYGKTIQLRNLCNDKKILFQLTSYIDQQIDLGEIEDGFYEIYVVNNLQEYRLISNEKMEDLFYTVTRNEKNKKVELIATDNYLEDVTLDHNYVFLNVTSESLQEDIYDILIDPYGGSSDTGEVRWGYQLNGLSENDEMYKAALTLKEKLEEYGLSVGISKNAVDQLIDISGENGRVELGYEKQAKLYLNLQFNSSQYANTRGIEITQSYYSSPKLAYQIIHDLENQVGLVGSMLYPGDIQNGVVTPYRISGDGNENIYDAYSQIRESGGIATGAGSMNSTMKEANSFATNNKKGMQALVMHLLYISNSVDYKLWIDDYEDIMSSIADSIATYYQIEKGQ